MFYSFEHKCQWVSDVRWSSNVIVHRRITPSRNALNNNISVHNPYFRLNCVYTLENKSNHDYIHQFVQKKEAIHIIEHCNNVNVTIICFNSVKNIIHNNYINYMTNTLQKTPPIRSYVIAYYAMIWKWYFPAFIFTFLLHKTP